MSLRALITGITGQDGSYLAEHLLSLGYEVHGTIRTTSQDLTLSRIGHLLVGDPPRVNLHVLDLDDCSSLVRCVELAQPDEIYNLAAQSHVGASFDEPVHTADVTATGVMRLLNTIRHINPEIRFYQASSSEMFGTAPPPQSEVTRFQPQSPYAAAKVFAYWSTVIFRESYGLHASNGIMFNHESPRRGREFVTRKITDAIARIRVGQQSSLYLGNLDTRRDWGHARDFVEVMHLILQLDEPVDVVIGTGESHTVREFVETAFSLADLDWREYVTTDPRLFRPSEVPHLQADNTKAMILLGWQPETSFEQLVAEMLRADCERLGVSLDSRGDNPVEIGPLGGQPSRL